MKVGMVGTNWGSALIKSLAKLDIEPVLVYGHKRREEFPHLKFTEEVDEVFDIADVVITAVPPSVNLDMVKKAVKYGTDIFIEKPMATSVEEAGIIKEIVLTADRICAIGHRFCYTENIQELREVPFSYAVLKHKRPPSVNKINPYWNIAIHSIALFEYLGIFDYAIELVLDPSFSGGAYNMLLWNEIGDRIDCILKGDLTTAEIKDFLYCCENHFASRTDVIHGFTVIEQLAGRYGGINDCIGEYK